MVLVPLVRAGKRGSHFLLDLARWCLFSQGHEVQSRLGVGPGVSSPRTCGVTSVVAPMSQEAGTREADQAGYVLCSGHLVTSGMEIDSPVSSAFLIIKLYILRRYVFTCTTVRTDSEPSCVPLPSFPKGSISQSCSTMSHPGYQRWMQSKFRLLLSRGCTFVATPTSLLPSPS